MPAHIGIADHLRLGAKFVVANISLHEKFRQAREMGGGHVSMKRLKAGLERDRAKREYNCQSYAELRELLNSFDPNKVVARDRINHRTCDQAEWDLYLKADTAFDSTLRRYFEIFRGMRMLLITHKSDSNKLKRIEAHPPGERMRVLWSEGA
jgi:hypothetical protein